MKTSHTKWNTTDEINHLNELGSFSEKVRLNPQEMVERRRNLLLNARGAYEKRVFWGDIKTLIVKQHLEMLIRREVYNGRS